MRRTSIADVCDPEVARQHYESLRANALGQLNCASTLTLFLRDGMSAWLRALAAPGDDRRAIQRTPSPVIAGSDSDMPATELISILVDAILNAAETAEHIGVCG